MKKIAIVAILISVSWLLWWKTRPISPEDIFDVYFEPYVIQTTPRGLIKDSDLYMLGIIHYRDMEYDSAISKFEKLLIETSDDYRAQLMLGISHFALKNFNAAENVFVQLVNDPNHLFQDQARWYLGLLYLTDEDTINDQKATKLFDNIKDELIRKNIEEIH